MRVFGTHPFDTIIIHLPESGVYDVRLTLANIGLLKCVNPWRFLPIELLMFLQSFIKTDHI